MTASEMPVLAIVIGDPAGSPGHRSTQFQHRAPE